MSHDASYRMAFKRYVTKVNLLPGHKTDKWFAILVNVDNTRLSHIRWGSGHLRVMHFIALWDGERCLSSPEKVSGHYLPSKPI